MKNTYLIILLSLSISVLFGQNIAFEIIPPPPPASQITCPFDGVKYGSIAYADIDNDNDEDVLITGVNSLNQNVANLYTNNGQGNYTLVNGTSFTPVKYSAVAFADIDNDNDQDVLITGYSNGGRIAKLYTNNGNGTFSLVTSTPFPSVEKGTISFADIDNDNDLDVLVTGYGSGGRKAQLFTNNGSGIFTIVSNTIFTGVQHGAVAFTDIDNDNDLDVLITGETSSSSSGISSKLYKNNGNGVFTLMLGTPFPPVEKGSVAFADIDGDNDMDVLITGKGFSVQPIVKLYKNNGSGIFTIVNNTPFIGNSYGNIEFADVDNDNDQDVIISGLYSSSQHTNLFINNGSGVFTYLANSFEEVYYCDLKFIDIDSDNDLDLIICGEANLGETSYIYLNNGSGLYTRITNSSFPGLIYSDVAFADIDNDNDQDLIITGFISASSNNSISRIYKNNGSGGYSFTSGVSLMGASYSSVAFADIDGDNDSDLVIMGKNNSNQRHTKLYTNNGSGTFTIVSGTPFDGLYQGDLSFADVDNDSDPDLLITGIPMGGGACAKLYLNNGNGVFALDTSTIFDPVFGSSIGFADIDGDSDLDVLITGMNAAYVLTSKLYTNNGSGTFTLVTGTPFVGSGTVAFSDVDNDSDLDVVIAGYYNSNPTSKLYKNNGNGVFTMVAGTPFIGVINTASVNFTDIDNDSDQDLLISGKNSSGFEITNLYTNNGSGIFSLVNNLPLAGVRYGSTAIADVNNDNYQDILITGSAGSGFVAELYRNITGVIYTNDSINACDSIVWIDGITYASNNYNATDTLTSVLGLDSVVTLNLTIIYSTTGNDLQTACGSYTWINGITYTASNNTATDTLVNAAGCDSIVTLNLTISSPSTATDTQTACNSYTWTNGITYTTSNNTATDTILNAAGCDSVITLNLTINIADVSTTTTDPSITANAIGASYQWLDCGSNYAIIPSETAQLFTATANGNYAVEVTENGCTDTSACVTISTVSLDEISLFQDITIYPNPSNGMVNIELGKLKNVTIKVLNSNGQMVYKKENINTKNYQFELKEAAGVYFIEVSSNEVKKEFKLVIKK